MLVDELKSIPSLLFYYQKGKYCDYTRSSFRAAVSFLIPSHCLSRNPPCSLIEMVSTRGIVVFSGGSAANSLVDVFNTVRESKNCRLSYIIPISDNGGSSSELIRVFGGPGIGDVRSA